MDLSMLSILYSPEAIERAKKRGRAYKCLMCETLTGEQRIGELGPMEDHVLKNHVSRDRVPYFCRLCTFKCQTRHQMDHHMKVYPRHKAAAEQMGVTKDQEHQWIVESPAPYKIGEADMKKFSQEESILFFLRKQAGELMSNTRAPQMAVPTPSSLNVQVTPHPMQMGNPLASPAVGGQQQTITAPSTQAVNQMSMCGGEQQLSISPMLDQTLMGFSQWLEDPVPAFSSQFLGTTQPQSFPQTFGSSCQTMPSLPGPLVGGSLTRPAQPVGTAGQGTNIMMMPSPPVQPSQIGALGNITFYPGTIGASQGTPNFRIPTSQPIPSACQVNGAVSQRNLQVGQSTFNLPLNMPMQYAPAVSLRNGTSGRGTFQAGQVLSNSVLHPSQTVQVISQGNNMFSQSASQAGQGATISTLTIPTPSTQSPPAVSLGYGTANQAAILEQSIFGQTTVIPSPQPSPAVTLGQGTSGAVLGTLTSTMQPTPTTSRIGTPGIEEGRGEVNTEGGSTEIQTVEQTEDPFEDSRQVNVSEETVGKLSEQAENQFEDINVPDEAAGSESSGEVVEDIRPQLFGKTETDYVSEAGLHYQKKRKTEAEAGGKEEKKRKIARPEVNRNEEREESTVQISLVAMNGLVEAIQAGNRQLAKNEKVMEKTEKALTEVTCMMGKVVDALTQFKNVVQESANEDRKREERWFDIERKREEERSKEREAERRREDRRRAAEKTEREELRQLIKDAVGGKISKKEEDKENKDSKRNKEEKGEVEDKGKKPGMKSVLGKSYTENSVKDFGKKKAN